MLDIPQTWADLALHSLRTVTIDVMSGEPAYVQLARILRAGIADGTYPPRTPVPSARRLSQEHGVAMGTANRALAVLKAEGLVVTVPGRGMYVKDKENPPAE